MRWSFILGGFRMCSSYYFNLVTGICPAV